MFICLRVFGILIWNVMWEGGMVTASSGEHIMYSVSSEAMGHYENDQGAFRSDSHHFMYDTMFIFTCLVFINPCRSFCGSY